MQLFAFVRTEKGESWYTIEDSNFNSKWEFVKNLFANKYQVYNGEALSLEEYIKFKF